ncbi:transcriptional regulator [Leptolyngbya sp. FACHB-671]|uniref:helix-turn-helix transcriptional regulator n=1 Tax=Leptolyngbya sp. FACHB-671 TaxID=2692812 RepID=UPI0016860520|nr:metalloregulator ArsR/SmtB family transcription factor [Leptolyngbya sp. FACHB-671]MBD2070098.1 transcriptional regulator [Leptolyngbya sp. FACHB-671]
MVKKTQTQETAVRTRRAIVQLLKQEGSLDAETLAARLGITAMAVRQHLYALQGEQLVTYQEQPRRMGRPAKLWQLTPAADRLFPDGYAELTLSLLNSVKEAFGEAGLDRLLEVRTRQQLETYTQQMEGKLAPDTTAEQTLKQRLHKLAEIRTHEGYMAEVQAQPDGSFLFVENHCPICAAATACTGLCAKELEIFQSILGNEINIERVEHIIAGERRCAYQVSLSMLQI